MQVEVGKRYKFKSNIGLSNAADGRDFTVISIDEYRQVVNLKFDNNSTIYNIDFDMWDKVVLPITKWEGSKIVFNFI